MQNLWYTLRVRARSEKAVAELLAAKEVEHFLPCCEELRPYSDRVRRVSIAAFPGYVFCRFALSARVFVLDTPGVSGLVGAANVPEPIEDSVIESLKIAFSQPGRASVVPHLRSGEMVRVLCGPMSGASGILLRSKGKDRVVISVDLLQRSVAVELDGASVLPVRGWVAA
ncbi:MAG: transcription termination/antitermination NusG family protein [Acidobacteriota bacterium]